MLFFAEEKLINELKTDIYVCVGLLSSIYLIIV